MILTIDIGNTHTVLGLWKGEQLLDTLRIHTDRDKTADEYHLLVKNLLRNLPGTCAPETDIEGGILSSVVPALKSVMAEAMKLMTGKDFLVVGPGLKTSLNIRMDNPAQLGADLVGPTLYGYTKETAHIESPDMREFARMCRDMGEEAYFVMEGHIYSPEDAIKCLYLGAHTVVVGSAITRPHLTAKRFVDLMGGYRDNWRDAEKKKH